MRTMFHIDHETTKMKISQATLHNNKNLKFGDFNVFVGGNGVGKTSFLTELYTKSTNTNKTKYYWINNVDFDSINISNDIQLLKGSLSRKVEGPNLTYHSTSSKNIDGNVDLSDNFTPDEYDQLEK